MSTEYPKINGVFKRYTHLDEIPEGHKKGDFIAGKYSVPEYEVLENVMWDWTEKLNGTNIRLTYDPSREDPSILIQGRSDNSMIPQELVAWFEKWRNENLSKIVENFPGKVIFYGEGMGPKIQKNQGGVKTSEVILFDVFIDGWWLKREAVIEIAKDLGMSYAKTLPSKTLKEAIDHFNYSRQEYSYSHSGLMEGWVGTPRCGLFNRGGDRIITKLKWKDFK